jgi:hypothetical protein
LCEKTYCHHGTTARACDKNLGGIRLVLLQSPLNHVCNGVAVTATLMSQCLLAANVPAGARVGRAGVDDNEAILLGKGLVRAASIVRLCGTTAVMNGYNNTRRCGELLWHIDVEGGLGWGVAERCDLLEATRCHCTLSNSGSSGDGKVARKEGEETHCDGSFDSSGPGID